MNKRDPRKDSKCKWTDEDVVRYDVQYDIYWVGSEFVKRVEKLVGALRPLLHRRGYALTQQQVDWLHDNSYIIA